MKKSLWISIIVVLLALCGFGIMKLVQAGAPSGPDYSVFYPAQSREHITPGSEHPAYNSDPPSGGWHYPVTAKKQFYDEAIPDGYVLHNMEHGDVWIAYNPNLSKEIKDELKQYAFSKIIITPREASTTDIALVAWERVDAFTLENGTVPETRIRDFIKRYRGKGPEQIPAGAMESTFN
ncbi:MAG: DUF3105 domain-containing protein [bacterium]|nr:DUF3105 domain-containing protein [bacterium]